MKGINKEIALLFTWAFIGSVLFPLGVLGIIFGATKNLTILLILGIVAVVFGFYVMPILWIKFGEAKRKKSLLLFITEDNILDVKTLAITSNMSEVSVKSSIKELLNKRYLLGYVFENEELKRNVNKQKSKFSIRCNNCGAKVEIDPTVLDNFCSYCGMKFSSEQLIQVFNNNLEKNS